MYAKANHIYELYSELNKTLRVHIYMYMAQSIEQQIIIIIIMLLFQFPNQSTTDFV